MTVQADPVTVDKAVEIERDARRRDVRMRWLLSAPALTIITLFAAGPLLIVLVYSFLTPGNYGNVKWIFSIDAWTNVVVQRDIFDNTLQWADAHLSIFWRSLKLSIVTTILTAIFGIPTAYFIATRSAKTRNLWLFLITIPFWTNLLVRTIAVQELIRTEGVINNVLRMLHIIDTPIQMMFTDFAIGFGMTYVYLPLMVLPVYASIEKLDFRLVEAGYDLYASRWTCFRRIILPLVKPGMIAGSILVFVPSLGAYVTPRVLGGGKNLMFGNLIELQFGQGRNWPLGAALSISLMVLVMVALIYYTRISSGGDKQNG
ncbi:MAG TPA: ABC transporter permease [Rhodobacteraceae bacterium]|jgi:spermidine/putrescine transport system permease protein|nr:ABC transporter permease [Pseudomonadota bacterium]MDA1286996.1 ABC transporter permease [Pseudomonadota bacterium]NQW13107.1 ABC transporter permease [Rhodobacter sp.]HBN32675.1 ABC transporter permease [Paracoccaceae bacterium]